MWSVRRVRARMGRPPSAKLLGLAVGFLVAAVIAVAGLTTGIVRSTFTSDPPFAVGTLAAGSIGGWIVGPAATRAHGRGGWLGVVAGLGLIAVLLGDLAVIGTAAMLTALAATTDPVTVLISIPLYAVLGLIIVGPFALPFTVAAAAIWATAMSRLREWDAMSGGRRA